MSRREISWEAEVEKVIRNRYLPHESLPQLISIIQRNRGLRKVFSDLADNRGFQALLFAQPADLLAAEEEFVLAFLPHASKSSIRKGTKQGKIALAELIRDETSPTSFPRLLGLSDEEWDKIGEDVKEVVAYFVLTFIRQSPALKEVINDSAFDYAKFQRAVEGIDTEKIAGIEQATARLMEVAEAPASGSSEIHPAIEQKAKEIGLKIMTGFVKNIDTVGLQAGRVLPNLITQFHLIADTWVSRILSKTKISSSVYEDTLDLLFRRGLLETQSVITWCANCSIDNPTFSQRKGHIPPARVSNSTCWSCQRQENFGAFYAIHDDLRKIMFYQDGLLAVYVAWLLEEGGQSYEAQKYTKESENDFVLKNGTLIEVKMFRAGRDARAVDASLRSSMAQLAAHVRSLKKEGEVVSRAALVWNRETLDKKSLAPYLERHSVDLEKVQVEVVGASDVAEWIEDLE